ncbi:helix-turn-helix transcriptional regulator [Pseudonocardia acaciae]|uniref:helix-turn-helix transcriptional regulator n=1 Tax=Pseudonocardia acaciae TaxID=551276 RepID=UPI00048C463B|nr:helix-turn-helix transcriptional regulator [Pseudonocardia acaciae]
MRRTKALVKVAQVMAAEPHGRYWGYELTREAKVLSGTLYPILRSMRDEGWLNASWENPEESRGRPPRQYYELTDEGRAALGALLAAARRERRFADLNWGLAGC